MARQTRCLIHRAQIPPGFTASFNLLNVKLQNKIAAGLMGAAVCLSPVISRAQNALVNPGFETAGANASLAAGWTTDTATGGPVYAIRTNDNRHSGSFNYEVYLAS